VCFLHKSWYTFMYLPACRIIQIGGRSHCSPLIVLTMSGSSCDDDASTVVDVLLFVVVVVVVVFFSLKSCRRFDEKHRNDCAVVVYEVLNPIIIADFILRAYQNQKVSH